MNPALWLYRSAQRSPKAPALFRGHRLVASYAEFQNRVASIGMHLRQSYGVQAGDRIGVYMSNRTEYLEALYATWHIGAIAVPINGKLHPKEAAWIIADAEAKVAIASSDIASDWKVASPAGITALIWVDGMDWSAMYQASHVEEPVHIESDETVWLFYTSGTTGKPKGVMIAARNLEHMALNYMAEVDQVGPDDPILYAAPMSHGAGIYNFMHVLKATPHIVPESGAFDPAEILELSAEFGNVSMFAAPTMVKRLVDHARAEGKTGEGIKTIVYAGGPMYLADIEEAVQVLGDRFVQIYGQGECPMGITVLPRAYVSDRSHPRWRERLASIGFAQASVRVAICDHDGNFLPEGEIGEIVVSGPTVMNGYWRNADATAKTIKDGWLWTGDMGSMDSDGFVTMRDRSKDMIISGGSNVYPREVEEALLQHPDVHEVAVVGQKHSDWGEIVVAFVVCDTLDQAALDRHCNANIARFKRPKTYLKIDQLPKNNYGKVLKTELRKMLQEGEVNV